MLGAAQRHADEKTWHVVVCARPVLIHDEHDELLYHCAVITPSANGYTWSGPKREKPGGN